MSIVVVVGQSVPILAFVFQRAHQLLPTSEVECVLSFGAVIGDGFFQFVEGESCKIIAYLCDSAD
jgi:hypothetical protein